LAALRRALAGRRGRRRACGRCGRVSGEVVEFAEMPLDETGSASFVEERTGGAVLRPAAGLAVGHGVSPG